jgi:3-methyladenine DNA glycosylase AlkC
MPDHPAIRFQAPGSIPRGIPLKEVLAANLVRLVGESFAAVYAKFDRRKFVRQATRELDELEMIARGRQIGLAIAEQLPKSNNQACEILIAALGPELVRTEGNGLAPFFYLPHSNVVAERLLDDFISGMQANYEITKRFSAEFCIRPYLVRHREAALTMLEQWTTDANPHVRRLVSEGTRPRLPWAMRLKEFQADPSFAAPLLERLKDDRELYVRRSVANHVGDILKDHPEFGFDLCRRWLKEVSGKKTPAEVAKNRRWMIRHAVRLPAKKGHAEALELRAAAK